MISCPDDTAVTKRWAKWSHTGGTPVPLGAHTRSRGTGSAVARDGQPPSEPPASGEGGSVIIVSVRRWITP
ncbi:hypothetical protein SGLAM104S_06675 [Streptomyces glaucescens]